MNEKNLCWLTLAEQARLIHGKEISPVEVVNSVLQQIEWVDKKVNAYITVMAEAALAAARKAEEEIREMTFRLSGWGKNFSAAAGTVSLFITARTKIPIESKDKPNPAPKGKNPGPGTAQVPKPKFKEP